ncbi:MAG: hypothetical protein WDO73_00255 [Ignavibacteriota bacterium]
MKNVGSANQNSGDQAGDIPAEQAGDQAAFEPEVGRFIRCLVRLESGDPPQLTLTPKIAPNQSARTARWVRVRVSRITMAWK